MTVVLLCASCQSWYMNNDGYRNDYSGICYDFDMTEWKFKNNKNRRYRLDLYNNSNFKLSEIEGSHIFKSGSGVWHDRGDYIILDFNDFERNRKQEKLEESLLKVTFIHGSCMVLKKKGRKDLKILPSNAVLRRNY